MDMGSPKLNWLAGQSRKIKKENIMDLIDNKRLEEKLTKSPAPRVTIGDIKMRISDVLFTKIGDTLTHCRIVLDNGFSVTGESACVNPENYDEEIGQKIAYDNAFQKLWAFFGLLLAEKQYNGKDKTGHAKEEIGKRIETGTAQTVNIADILKDSTSTVHKDSGVPSDVTGAVVSAFLAALNKVAPPIETSDTVDTKKAE